MGVTATDTQATSGSVLKVASSELSGFILDFLHAKSILSLLTYLSGPECLKNISFFGPKKIVVKALALHPADWV